MKMKITFFVIHVHCHVYILYSYEIDNLFNFFVSVKLIFCLFCVIFKFHTMSSY
jgi:hypothetical protein